MPIARRCELDDGCSRREVEEVYEGCCVSPNEYIGSRDELELSRNRKKQMPKTLMELIDRSSPEPLPFSNQGLSQRVRTYLANVMREQQQEGKETHYTEQDCGMFEEYKIFLVHHGIRTRNPAGRP